MVSEPVSNQRDIFRADQPPLSDLWSVHSPSNTERGKLSPAQNKNILPGNWQAELTGENQLSCQCQRGYLRQNEKCWQKVRRT